MFCKGGQGLGVCPPGAKAFLLVTDNRRSRLDSPFCVIPQHRKFEFGHHRQSKKISNAQELTMQLSQTLSSAGLGKYWKLNRSSRWRHYLTNFHRKKNWYLSRKLMTINEVLWINPDFRTMVVRYCVWWPEFLVSNILRCSATHVKANTRLERVRR